MLKKNRSAPNTAVIPALYYPNAPEAVAWLTTVLPFTERLRNSDNRRQLSHGNSAIVVTKPGGNPDAASSTQQSPGAQSFTLRVTSIDELFLRAKAAGARVLAQAADHPYGERQCWFLHPRGIRGRFANDLRFRSSRLGWSTPRRISVRALIAVGMVFGLVPAIDASIMTKTPDPNQVEVVTVDVVHFWRAFDESAKVPTERRVDVYRREYFDLASEGLKDYAVFRHVTAETLAAHVEQNRDAYATIRPCVNNVVKQKPVIQTAFRRLKALYPDIKFPAHVYFVVGPQKGACMNSDNGIILAADMFATPPGHALHLRESLCRLRSLCGGPRDDPRQPGVPDERSQHAPAECCE